MLRFKELIIDNFGPYKERQSIKFDNGVNIVWGNNSRGKTTLLNAFRYVLYGKVYGRDPENTHSLADVSNWESAIEKKYGFSVSLKMEYNSNTYMLTRTYSLKDDVSVPRDDGDYKDYVFLKKENTIMSDVEMRHTLESMMPENISRFFLFDGELLSEYEDLLRDSKSIGLKIKESIEKILGVPILTSGLANISSASVQFSKRLTDELKKDDKSKKLGLSLASELEERDILVADLEELKDKHQSTDEKRNRLEALIRKSERASKLLERRDNLISILAQLELDKDQAVEALKALNRNLWLTCLDNTIKTQIKSIDAKISVLKSKEIEVSVNSCFVEKIKESIKTGSCPICKQTLSSLLRESILNDLASDTSNGHGLSDEENSMLNALRSYRAVLSKELEKETLKSVKKAAEDLAVIQTNIAQRIQEIYDTKSQLANYSGLDEIKSHTLDLAQCLKDLEVLSESIEDHEKLSAEKKTRIKQLEDKIGQIDTGISINKIRRLKETAEKLESIFSMGRDLYTSNLKSKIEDDATVLFRSLSSEPEYDKLIINENYGLNIMHIDGSIITIKSAGYMHIVSLCLIGALQKNAPMQGPVIIDSPFGRLDSINTINLTQSLDLLSHEVIVLLYDNEINAQEARDLLKDKLVREYNLKRITSRNTQIIEGGY